MRKELRAEFGTGMFGGLALLAVAAAPGCGDRADRDTNGLTSAATSVTGASTITSAGTSAEPTTTGATGEGATSTTGVTGTADSGVSITTWPATTDVTSGPDSTSEPGTTTGFTPEYFMLSDPLINGTMGTPVGGSFGDDGWTVTGNADRIYWAVPRLAEGSVTFKVTNITHANLPLNDHEIFAMYEGGYGIEHPIGYSPEFRNNAYKSMIRIYGQAEPDRVGKQKIMWGICPFGAGYHDGTCPCQNPVGFFEEPFGGDGNWDGSTQTLKVEWKDGVTRYYRNDVETLSIDWSGSGFTFGPQALYVSLGNPRPEAVDSASMPIGAVFSDVVIEGWTGPETPICGQ